MFVDTSAIVAILLGESDADDLAHRLEATKHRYSSTIVRLEASIILSTRLDITPSQAQGLLDDFFGETGIYVVPITDSIGQAAVECFAKFGEGRHPAGLNLGDCFSYACAKSYRAPLLFKGDDFAQTDVNKRRA